MGTVIRLVVRMLPTTDSDAEEMADLTDTLKAELLNLDSGSVAPFTEDAAPEGAKGLAGMAGSLLAWFDTPEGLRAVLAVIRGFTSRTGRAVEVNIDGNVLKLSAATAQQQEKIIDAWLAQNVSGS